MSSIRSFSTVSEADDLSLTLTIDEIRWLHASEVMVDSPTEETEAASALDAHAERDVFNSNPKPCLNATRSAIRLTPHTSTPSVTSISKSAGTSLLTGSTIDSPSCSRSTPPSSYAYKPNPNPPTSTLPTSIASFPHSLRMRTSASPLRRAGNWDKHRHYLLERDVDVFLEAKSSNPDLDLPMSSSLRPLSSSISEPSTPNCSPSLKVRNLTNTSSLIPIPVPAPTENTPTTPVRSRTAARVHLTQSTPPQQSLSLPTPSSLATQRKEWIYRHPKPRTAPSLSLATTTVTSTSINTKSPSPKSSSPKSPSPKSSSPGRATTQVSRLPVPVRTRTRSISSLSSRPSPVSVGAKHVHTRPRHGSNAMKQRPRPQTGYLAHADADLSTNTGDVKKHVPNHGHVHSTIPARTKSNGKEKEKEKPFWSLLRSTKSKGNEEGSGERGDWEESSPGSKILDIVNTAAAASSLLLSRTNEAENDDGADGKGKDDRSKLKKSKPKAKGIALVIGRARLASSQQIHQRSASLSSNVSSTSTTDDADTVSSGSTATPAPFTASTSTITVTTNDMQTSVASSTLPRNRASSSSSESSNSSAHSTSTAATSPSPSVTASPKPPLVPTKSILTRSSSTSSRAPPPSGLAALFGLASAGSGSGPSSMKSVTFVEEPTVHYPYDSDIQYRGYPGEEEAAEYEYEYDENQYASGSDDGKEEERTKIGAELQSYRVDEDELGPIVGLSKNALAWEMGVDVETMDLSFDADLSCESSSFGAGSMSLDTEMLFDIGQSYIPRERAGIEGIEEENEDELDGEEDRTEGGQAKERKAKKGNGLKRLLNLAGSGGGKTNSKSNSKSNEKTKKVAADTSPVRPMISGPFALGSVPPPAPSSSFQSRSLPSSSIHVHSAAGRSHPQLPTGISRSRSNSSSHTYHTRYPRNTENHNTPIGLSTPLHLKCHSYSHPPRHHSHDSSKTDPSPSAQKPYASSSLHHAPSTESFGSIAGRSVRSLGSVRSTASTNGFRAWLARVGEGAKAGESTKAY